MQQSVRFDPPIEPPRRELFLPGTEQTVIGLPADKAPHIIGLTEGDTLHLNPDLPATWQTVRYLRAPHAPAGTGWWTARLPPAQWRGPTAAGATRRNPARIGSA